MLLAKKISFVFVFDTRDLRLCTRDLCLCSDFVCHTTDTNANLLYLCPACVHAKAKKTIFSEKLFRLCRKKAHCALAKVGP